MKPSNVIFKTKFGKLKVLGQKTMGNIIFYQVFDESQKTKYIISKRLFQSILLK